MEFGLLRPDKYRADVVRAFRLEPKPGTFNRGVVTNGWGYPDRMGHENESDLFLYREGLLVYFDQVRLERADLDDLHALPQPARPDRRAVGRRVTSPRTGIATQSGRLLASYTIS